MSSNKIKKYKMCNNVFQDYIFLRKKINLKVTTWCKVIEYNIFKVIKYYKILLTIK